MEKSILEDLNDLGQSISSKEFKKMIAEGANSIKFTQLVEWLTKEIQVLSGQEEHVNAISSEADSLAFLLEVSAFLKESGCSYDILTLGIIEDRLYSNEERLLLLDYLVGELRAYRILKSDSDTNESNMQVSLIESNTTMCLNDILLALGFPEPPQNIDTTSLFNKVNTELQTYLKTVPSALIGKSLVCNSYSNEQWEFINKTIELFNKEFNIRKNMLLTRLDVTVQSFKWPDRLKNKNHELEEIYQAKLNLINKLPSFSISDFLLAREDLRIFEKTSSTLAVQNTNSSVNKVMIGQVPDRGGRPNEQQAPPPEMPSWQQRTQTQGSRGSHPSRRGQFNSRGSQGRGQQSRDNNSYRNSNTFDNQSGSNVYEVTDGFQSIRVDNEYRNFSQNNRRGGRVQGGWNNNQSRDFQSGSYGTQNYYDHHRGSHQNKGNDYDRFQTASNERQWNQDLQHVYGNNQDDGNRVYDQNDFADGNRRGYSKRRRGQNGQTYYNQQKNNQNY